MKTSVVKLSDIRYSSHSESKQAELNLAKLRLLPQDLKCVHKPGQVFADEVSGLFAARFLVISVQAIYTAPEIAVTTRQSRQPIVPMGTL